MNVKNATDVLFATTVTSRRPPVPELVLIAKAKLDWVPDGVMTLCEGIPQLVQGPLEHDVYAPDDEERTGAILRPSDFAQFKPHGEVMLTGSCHTPRGRRASELGVKIAVGRWSKSLRVLGDREKGTKPADAKTFTTLPLDYAHAYGGAGHPLNPVGKGHADKALPNVTDPSDTDKPPRPASFAPLNPQWPQRASRMGTRYDERYFAERFPFYAEDFDWRHFQAAPSDQWIDGFWKGDETITLTNLHPEHAELTMQLPGLRIRAFVNDDRDRFREVTMVLDTIFLDAEAQTTTLTWRGQTPIRKVLATDVKTILVAQEKVGDRPKPEDDYREQLRAFEADPLELEASLPPDMKEILDALEEEHREPASPIAEVQRIADRMAESMGGVGKEQQAQIISLLERRAKDKPELAAQLGESLNAIEAGEDSSSIPPFLPIAPGAQPRMYLREHVEQVRKQLGIAQAKLSAQRAAAPEHLHARMDAELARMEESAARFDDPELLALDPTLRPIAEGEPGPGADLSGQDLSKRDLRGVDLRGARLDGALLTDANLRGVDLSDASLDGTVLFRTDLSDANLAGADLSRCNAAEAILTGANLAGCKLREAYFKDAKMAGCKLPDASGRYCGFPQADLTGASLRGADLEDADFQGTDLTDADLSGATLTKAFFREAKAHRTRLEGASLDQTSFMECDLEGARLNGAKGERTSFLKANLADATLDRSVLASAFFDDARAPRASFAAADLRDARLCRMDLTEARFDRANLFKADLGDAEVDRASFREANLYDAKMLRTAGESCDMTGANTTLTRVRGGL